MASHHRRSSSSSSEEESHKRIKAFDDKGRKKCPNILICGTPGVGKTTLSDKLADKLAAGAESEDRLVEVVHIGEFAREHGYVGKYDEMYKCFELDEDAIVDHLEPKMSNPKSNVTVIVDHHVTDYFPERWFDAVFVLRTNNTVLYDRLHNDRGYSGKKLDDNIQCEIFNTILDEAKECYKEQIVHELTSETHQDMESNVQTILAWIKQWISDNKNEKES